jgi:mono/diheme cytochrome c family protein
MTIHRRLILVGLTLLAIGLTPTTAHSEPIPNNAKTTGRKSASSKADLDTATYLRDIRPIFMGKCGRCHNSQSTMLPNWLDYKTAFADRAEIKRRVWDSWKGAYYKQPMPAGNGPECQAITANERRMIREWVNTGASLGVLSDQQTPKNKGEKIEGGKQLYSMVCAACHQPTGQGIPNQFPPLADSDFLNADKSRAIKTLLHGRQGEIVVNGRKFNNSMPSFPLSDQDIANALTFVYSSFGNSGKEVTAEEVKVLRADKDDTIEQQQVVSAPPEPSPFE